MYCFGIDIGGTAIKIGLIDCNMVIIDKWEIKTNIVDKGKHILSEIYMSIKEYLLEKQISLKEIAGFGFGVPGPVVNNVVEICMNLGWKKVDVAAEFKKLLNTDIKVAVCNDAKAACYGEYIKSSRHFESMVMVTLGTGFGCGIIINDKIVEGFNGTAGEVGHLRVDNDYNFLCNCNKTGCIETVCSATGVLNLYKYYFGQYQTSLKNDNLLTSKAILDAAMSGDELSLKAVDIVCDYAGSILCLLSSAINPEVFVIGGGMSKLGDFILERIKTAYILHSDGLLCNTEICLAKLANDAGIYGAAFLINYFK